MRLCSALVTTRGSPKGRHPWDTRVATSAPGPRNAPTAPAGADPGAEGEAVAARAARRRGHAAHDPAGRGGGRRPSRGRTRPGSCRGRPRGRAPRGRRGSRRASRAGRGRRPSPTGTASSARGTSGPTCPANSVTAASCSTSRCGPSTDSAAQPSDTRGWSTSSTVRMTSSSAPAWGGVTNTVAKSGRSPMRSSTAPVTSPTAWAVSGCSLMAAAKGIAPTLPPGPRGRARGLRAVAGPRSGRGRPGPTPATHTAPPATSRRLGLEGDEVGTPPRRDGAAVVEPEQPGRRGAGRRHGVGRGRRRRGARRWTRRRPW